MKAIAGFRIDSRIPAEALATEVVTAIHEVLKGQVRRADFAARRAARSDRLFIAKIRIAKGVSQTELARRLGVSKQ
jgi:hypothetical protein